MLDHLIAPVCTVCCDAGCRLCNEDIAEDIELIDLDALFDSDDEDFD